jgi:mannitol-specific phosphotransferase system IIBC component
MTTVKSPILTVVLSAVIASVVSFDYCLGENKQRYEPKQLTIEERLENQKQRLELIKEAAAKKRRKIEDSYAYRHHLLQLRTGEYISTLKLPNRVLWTEFIKAYNKISYTDSCIEAGHRFKFDTYLLEPAPIFLLNLKAKQALGRMLDFYANAIQPDFLAIDRDFPVCRKLAATTDTFEPWQIRQIRKLFLTMKEFESESIRLEKQKMLRLAEVAQWEKQLTEEVSKTLRQIKTAPEPIDYGMVIAICDDGKGMCCMIEGIERIIRQGAAIDNIRVSEILPDRVKFQKNRETWVQLIGQSPSDLW